MPFRVTRNADLTVEDEEADDLLAAIEMELRRRRFGKAVRLEVEDDISAESLELIRGELELSDEDVFAHAAPVDLGGLFAVHDVDRPELKYPDFVPVTQRRLTTTRTSPSRTSSVRSPPATSWCTTPTTASSARSRSSSARRRRTRRC